MKSILYMISIFILFVLFCMSKKSENKLDMVPNIILAFLCMLAYQVIICLVFSIFSISIHLIHLSICNFLVSIMCLIFLEKKGMQKYMLTKKDAIVTFILIIVSVIILYQDMGNLENIRYYSTDASIHYIAAKEFYQNNKMLNQTENTETFKQMMPMAYVNVGILFKVFAPLIKEINLYKIFLWFDSTIFCFSALLFYFIIKNKIKSKWHIIFACLITIIYLIGYPLNNLLNGFYYLGIGCLMINGILYHMSNKDDSKITFLIRFFLNVGIIFSYSLFAPVIYLAMFIYDSYCTYQKYHKVWNKKFIINTILTLILPGSMAILFLILPDATIIQYLANEGYIHKNLFVNIVFFLPFVIYYLWNQFREKKIDFKLLYFFILVIYMVCLYCGTKIKVVSEYYFYKNAYILWAILLIYFFYGVVTFIQKYKEQSYIAIIYCISYIWLLAFTIIGQTHILNLYDIYENNIFLLHTKESLTQDDITMLSYIKENNLLNKKENNILFIGDFMQEAWIRSIFQYYNRYPLEQVNYAYYIEKWNQKEISYLVCFENSRTYQILKDTCQLEEAKLLFETKYAKIYGK